MEKNIFLFIVLLVSNVGVCSVKGSIELYARNCNVAGGEEYGQLGEFEIFHNNRAYGKQTPETVEQRVNGFLIPELFEEGLYSIEYKSIFGKIERKTFKVLKGYKQKVILCLDKINHKNIKYIPIIDRLKNGESYVIQNTYRGSFDLGVESIWIQKKHGTFYAEFITFAERKVVPKLHHYAQRVIYSIGTDIYSRETVLKKNGDIYSVEMTKNKVLSKNNIILIENFEKELSLLRGRSDFCSWENSFLISYKNTRIKIPGSRCYWRGWQFLLEKLGWKAFENYS